jgi:hypothetical protein
VATNLNTYRPQIRVRINDIEYAAIGVSVDFELNAIPRCRVSLAVGQENVQKPTYSAVHRLASILTTERLEILVEAKIDAVEVQGTSLFLPHGWFKLFEGDTVSGSPRRDENSVAFDVVATHWLGRLTESSTVSKSSHARNPSHYSFGAASRAGVGAGGSTFAWTTGALSESFFTASSIREDLWSKAIRPFLETLARLDLFALETQPLPDSGANKRVLDVLSRMVVPPTAPLSIDMDASASGVLRSMSRSLVGLASIPQSIAQQTFWDLLVGQYAANYMFYVVPRINDVLIAPVTPGLRGIWTTISAGQIFRIEDTSAIAPPLRGIVVESRLSTTTGGFVPGVADAMGPGGVYLAPNKTEGVVEVRTGPDWTADVVSAEQFTPDAVGLRGSRFDALSPPVAAAPNPGKAQAKTSARAARAFLDSYAHALYAWSVTQGRQLVIQGPFRTDIAPGSVVAISPYHDSNIPYDELKLTLYGTVLRTTLAVDSEARVCGTAFHIGYVRLSGDYENPAVSLDRHPLYKTLFRGSTLI